MISTKLVGRLSETQGEIEIEWEVPDFLSSSDERYQSPTFLFSGATWCIHLYPNGQKDKGAAGWISVFVSRLDLGHPIEAISSAFLKTARSREQLWGRQTFSFVQLGANQPGYSWGKPKIMRRSELTERKSQYMPSGALTVICCLKCSETRDVEAEKILRRVMKNYITSVDVRTQTDADAGTEKLMSDLKGLVVSGDDSDMTVRVQGEEFRLHRAIMAARTPVFGSMFRHDTKEKATGVVSVDDCEAGPFRAFVHYLYTGSTDELTTENVFSLYTIADKYQVDELKDSCLDVMRRTLSVETFCDALDLALRHDERGLIQRATDFLSENSSEIMGREDWQNLMRNNPKQISEILMQSFIRTSKRH